MKYYQFINIIIIIIIIIINSLDLTLKRFTNRK
jgi:hypothetical protein